MKDAPLRDDAEITLPVDQPLPCCGTESRRRMMWCCVPDVVGVWKPAVHSPCMHNEYSSLLLRTLGPTPRDPGNAILEDQFRILRDLVRKKNVARWDKRRVVDSYSGKLRRRYEEALESFAVTDELQAVDMKCKPFLKAEKFNPLLKPSKPRMIVPRSPRYNLEISTWLKPLEHCLWKALKGPRFKGVRATRAVGKGLDGFARAALIREKMENVGGDCVVFEVDGKSFESHVSRVDLQREHSVYKAAYPGDTDLAKALECQLSLRGTTTNGIKFSRPGARASGDFNTGLGNTIIMYAAVRGTFVVLTLRHGAFAYDLLVDGDNALIFVESRLASIVHAEFADATRVVSAQELAVEKPTRTLEQVVFGQSKPCYNGQDYIMVRDPWKTLSNAFSGYRHYDHYKHGLRVLKAVSQCELALARGIPLLEAYFDAALQQLRYVSDLKDPSMFLEGRQIEAISVLRKSGEKLSRVKARGVTPESRTSFFLAFGITVEEQVELESKLRREARFPGVTGSPMDIVTQWFSSEARRLTWEEVFLTDGPFAEGADEDAIRNFLGA